MNAIVRRSLVTMGMMLMLSACSGFRSSEPQHYLLMPTAKTADVAAQNFSIGVGPVHVAQFLQRPQIVTHDGSGNLRIDNNERWGEPLEPSIQRVLVQNLSALTGAQTRNFPWRQNLTPDYALRMDVIDLDKVGNSAILDVTWSLEDLKNARMLKTQQQRFSTTVAGVGNGSLASAYSELFAQLAQQVAETLNTIQR
jgi:uncharacterized lipoprotein YmbA